MAIVRLALDVPLPTLFDYEVEETVLPGQCVAVSFGSRQLIGLVIACVAETEIAPTKLRAVNRILANDVRISSQLLALLRFCSDYYHYPIGQTVHAALPSALRSEKQFPADSKRYFRLTEQGRLLDLSCVPKRKLVAHRLLQALVAGDQEWAQLQAICNALKPQLLWLLQQGWVEEVEAAPALRQHVLANAHALTDEQNAVVAHMVGSSGFQCFLLHGITGSGKTEVYVHLMDHVLQRGGQVLLLVPEINLTPQLEDYFSSRFPATTLVSLHSGLSENARMRHWRSAYSGAAQIVLGTRSAIFAELPKLALIIVDEEHDASFKQQDGLRYSARDVAIFRARQNAIPIILGSATPSLESYQNALIGRYQLLKLAGRANPDACLPSVTCINIQQSNMTEGLSEKLLREIGRRLERGEQSLLFINRRGYAPVLMCTECGWLSDCKSCAGKMVLHRAEGRLRCHHCGYQIRVPTACPSCAHVELLPVGSGTQRIEAALQQRFPEARVLRVDRDSTRSQHVWTEMRERIRANDVDILVGTQMLAKGHDFPALTLVGVINPDAALYSADFRAAERLFAQLMQVAGRAGRAEKPGEVLIQTDFPDHPLFRCLQQHDFSAWAEMQLAERSMAGFPPFAYQAMLRAEGRGEAEVYAYLNRARRAAQELGMGVEILGVVPASLARRADHVRAQLLIQATDRRTLQQFLCAWQPLLTDFQTQKLRCSLDIDPLEF